MVSLTLMSLATSVKDYVEITHKLIEVDGVKTYTELGAVFSYLVISIGNVLKDFFSFSFLKNIWSIPLIIPDVASAMISEVSVLDGYFHNAFTFLETGVNSTSTMSTSNTGVVVIIEKLFIGLINSFFLFLPTSTSHLITLRRFVMQGLEAGYIAGLGTLAGNFLWLASIILGWRFFVIPWLSFDIFRYVLGFILIVKYIWDSSKERRMALEDVSKTKIFLLNFLLALTEQTCIYPFISNLSFGPEASIIEGFAVESYGQFILVHGAYLLGILLGSFSLLQFTCWFWENPAFSIYIWITTKSSNKISTSSYYKILNFTFLYATMLCAIASIPYYGLDYTITNPIGLVPQDRILDQRKSQSDTDKLIPETAFLGVNPTDKNTRIRDGVHARRERWKQRLIKYQAYDASIYDQGVYDFLTIEDLNYGFDRFWLRRKMRNHQIRFRLFPGPWMRSLKKQLNKPANLNNKEENLTKSATGPRVDFFRILFEQFYHPVFHDRSKTNLFNKTNAQVILKENQPAVNIANTGTSLNTAAETSFATPGALPILKGASQNTVAESRVGESITVLPTGISLSPTTKNSKQLKPGLIYEYSALRKFVRNFNKRTNLKFLNKTYSFNTVLSNTGRINNLAALPISNSKGDSKGENINLNRAPQVYSKRWKALFSKLQPSSKTSNYNAYLTYKNISKQILTPSLVSQSLKLTNLNQKMSSEDFKILTNSPGATAASVEIQKRDQLTLLRPLSFYLQKEQAFKRKLRYYGSTTMRKLTVGNQAPYFKTLMKRGFYYYKPSLRFKKTMYVASMRRGFRKKSRKQKVLVYGDTNATTLSAGIDAQLVGVTKNGLTNQELSPNNASYSILNKRASRYRHQIYKDVLQHWYYTPFNRLALKFDIDAFMNRQPKSYNLTKNEERLLHVKRFLLAEHYDTLRWYTYMQHYNTMKNTIGGTKSFASRPYNQQFQGTFKKIRHLFAITPTQENLSILKFDQPLYNNVKDKNLIYFHEELLPENLNSNNTQIASLNSLEPSTGANFKTGQGELQNSKVTLNSDKLDTNNLNSPKNLNGAKGLIDQSQAFIGQNYLSSPWNRGGQLEFPASEGGSVYSVKGAGSVIGEPRSQIDTNQINSLINKETSSVIYNELLVKLIKECKRHIYDQAFLKNYITHRIEKREQRSQEQIKELNKRLEKLKTWLSFKSLNEKETVFKQRAQKAGENQPANRSDLITTGMQKALNDSLFVNTNINPLYSNKPLVKINSLENKFSYLDLQPRGTLVQLEKIQAKLNVLKSISTGFPVRQTLPVVTTETLNNGIKGQPELGPGKNLLTQCKDILTTNLQLAKTRTSKNLEWWRKKQRVLTKRKNARKRDRFKKQMAGVTANIEKLVKQAKAEQTDLFKTLYGNYEISDYLVDSTKLRKKVIPESFTDRSEKNLILIQEQNGKTRNQLKSTAKAATPSFTEIYGNSIWDKFFMKKFRKKNSSKGRRYRSLSYGRYLTATRKPKLLANDILENSFDEKLREERELNALIKIDAIRNSTGSSLNQLEKQERLNLDNSLLILKQDLNPNLSIKDLSSSLKNVQIQKRSRHTWKKYKRHKFNTAQNKYKKRKIQSRGKLRVMSKKYLKLVATMELRQWWWNSFLPRYYSNITVKNTEQSTGLPLSNLKTGKDVIDFTKSNSVNKNSVFKPLSKADLTNNWTRMGLPELPDSEGGSFNSVKAASMKYNVLNSSPLDEGTSLSRNESSAQVAAAVALASSSSNSTGFDQATVTEKDRQLSLKNGTTTTLPFYAGWDESLRKFVVTNRYLSRRDAGLQIFNPNASDETERDSQLSLKNGFTNSPIQGLNEGSFLYWQTDMPFNSYNIDQFISTNQSFYAPLGWRRFEFRHSILKTWYSNYKKLSTGIQEPGINIIINSNNMRKQLDKNLYMPGQGSDLKSPQSLVKVKAQRAVARRIKKRYKLLKQTPSQLMYTPTGPLLLEVLPSHYVSVFDQQYRFPRNRYLKRNLLKSTKKTTLLAMLDASTSLSNKDIAASKDFTLRKRVKPRRKYHRKRFIKKDGLIFPRRTKFTASWSDNVTELSKDDLRWRPSSRSKQKRNQVDRSKSKSNKRVKTNPLRLRQLRRREFQQILKPTQRYQPRNGGFTWPGDYLRLEVVEMPKLKLDPNQATNATKKTSLKQKINVQPVGIMPRQYLIEKHNILVLKKRLEKAHAVNQLPEVIKEYKLLTQNMI